MTGVVVLLSGGLDSTVLAALLADDPGYTVGALSVDYGQRHSRELEAAAQVAGWYGMPHTVLDLSVLGPFLSSALTGGGEVPHGHYAQDTMAATVVPNRNAIMLMCAVGYAASRGYGEVATAVHAGDHPVYPDCRPEFISAASQAARLGTAGIGDVSIEAPFVGYSKARIVELGAELGAPLGLSWSCYEGGERHCGRCGTCVERAEAFHLAGVADPTVYVDAEFWKEASA